MNVPEELKKPLSADEKAHLRKFALNGGPEHDFPLNLIFRREVNPSPPMGRRHGWN